MKDLSPICPYCGVMSQLATGATIYAHRPDLGDKSFYLCAPCDAYVGCHAGTTQPLGRLANAELRLAKKAAHAAFDPIWKARHAQKSAIDPTYKVGMARGGRYKKLANLLGIPVAECHIGMMDVELCKRTVEICRSGQLLDEVAA